MINDLATMFGLGRTAVLANITRLGAESRRGIVDRRVEEASTLYLDGWSLARIGKRYGRLPINCARRAAQGRRTDASGTWYPPEALTESRSDADPASSSRSQVTRARSAADVVAIVSAPTVLLPFIRGYADRS